MSWAQAKRAAAAVFHSVDGILIPLLFDDHPPLIPRVSAVSPLDPSFLLPVVMKRTSSSSLQIMAERHGDSDHPYLLAG